ncbi:hypothetical protein FRC10_008500 [Ceratobasidium sp. 414]|nr:hypothetical protein FRC10_008500 [Ceratobasidium sp. 414]
MSPKFEQLAGAETNEKVQYYKVDTDACQDIASEVGIRVMPTFMAFKDGQKIADFIGAIPAKLENMITTARAAAV